MHKVFRGLFGAGGGGEREWFKLQGQQHIIIIYKKNSLLKLLGLMNNKFSLNPSQGDVLCPYKDIMGSVLKCVFYYTICNCQKYWSFNHARSHSNIHKKINILCLSLPFSQDWESMKITIVRFICLGNCSEVNNKLHNDLVQCTLKKT